MTSLENVLQFIIKKNLEIILDNISVDFNIEREKLDKYIETSIETNASNSNDTQPTLTSNICQGKTKKGELCPNKAKPNTNFCGKHST